MLALERGCFKTMPRVLRLVYLPMRGRAEAIRMSLLHHGIRFEDVVLDYDAYAYSKERGELPFSQVSCQVICTHPPSSIMSAPELRYMRCP